jgi:large repetitive protein
MMATAVVLVAACAPGPRSGVGDDDDTHTDAASQPGGDAAGSGETVYVYAHTATALYRVDPDSLAISLVGSFGWPSGADQMTDIAIDKTGSMIGISYDKVYKVDPSTAQATLLSASLDGDFNGLSYVPASMLGGSGDDVLVGTRNTDGEVFRIDPMTGVSMSIGNMGGSFSSSGDLVAIDGFGTVQTVPGSSGDQLATLAPQTFAATGVGTGTGYTDIWGLAFWKGKVYGFTDTGQFVLIDPTTGNATLVSTNNEAWWGAAVTTIAPIIQ